MLVVRSSEPEVQKRIKRPVRQVGAAEQKQGQKHRRLQNGRCSFRQAPGQLFGQGRGADDADAEELHPAQQQDQYDDGGVPRDVDAGDELPR